MTPLHENPMLQSEPGTPAAAITDTISGQLGDAIVATVVPHARRAAFLPSHFGASSMLRVETEVCSWLRRLCEAYTGGHLHFVELSNGGAYLAPAYPQHVDLVVESNGCAGRCSADAAGFIATMYAMESLFLKGHEALLRNHERLSDFIPQHPERHVIRRALD